MRASGYFKAFKVSLLTRMEYRSDFFLGIIAALGLQAAALGMLSVVLSRSTLLGGWNGREVALLFGLTAMIQGFSELFFNHIWWIPAYVMRGQVDRLLVYPVKSLPFLLITSPEWHALGNLCGGLAVYSVAAHMLGLGFWAWGLLPLWVICGSITYSSTLVMCAALSFKFLGQKPQHYFMAQAIFQATRYPLGIYPKIFGFLVLVLLPYGAENFMPMSWATGRLPIWSALGVPVLAALAFAWLAFQAWEAGLRNYESTGT